MTSSKSRILGRLRTGQQVSVFKANLSDPRVVEIAGLVGVDAVWLCNEHVPSDWLAMENQIRAARLHGIDALVRVSRGSYSDYIRPLEAGAAGIIVPHVESADEARRIVSWTRFHPIGQRAIDGGNVDGQFCLMPVHEYIRLSNEERVIILQIESPAALAAVDEIAAVPGFDGLLFGPGDFSHRIGKVDQMDAPEVVNARRLVAAAARRHGKFAMAPGLIAPYKELVAEGYRVFGVGADVLAVAEHLQHGLHSIAETPPLPAPPSSPYSGAAGSAS